jgi:hypothetical protein
MRELAGAYERTALRWEELQAHPADANKVFDENHSIYKQLREHEEGRLCIARLMAHESPAVRLLAATHSLAWQPEPAAETLEAIEREGGLRAVTAKWTLRSYRAGKLDLDW